MRYVTFALAGILCGVLVVGVVTAPPVGAVAPPNNNLTGATNIPAPPPYSNTVDTTDASRETGEPLCDLISATVWYKHTPTANVTLRADTVGSNFDTVLAVFSGPASSPAFSTLSLVGCNDDALGGNQSQVVFAAIAGTTYYFQVGGVAGSTGSLTLNLAVDPAVPPSNDNFSNAVNASTLPYSFSQATVGATLQPSEQRPCGDQIGTTVWYKHTPGAAGVLTATTAGSAFDTVLAVYTGSSFAALTNLACDDDGGPGKTSQLAFNVASGTAYYFQAGGFDNATGNLVLNLSFAAAPDSDNDGWSDTAESTIGTDPLRKCGANAWPPDINNDGLVDIIGDISQVAGQFGKSVPPTPPRYDIAPDPPDGLIDVISDIVRLAGLFGQNCTP